jgi:hypothetical protein
MALWDLIPRIVRYKDSLASGGPDAVGNFQKVVECLEQEVGVTETEIREFGRIMDVDITDPEFLLFISATLGTMVDSGLGLPFQRWFVKNLVGFYKVKGTHLGWDKQFRWVEGILYKAWELWKSVPYEEGDYSRFSDYTHQLRAARFDLYYLDPLGNPVFLSPTDASQLVPVIESLRPIHVVLRHNMERVDQEETLRVSDSLAGSGLVGTYSDSSGGILDGPGGVTVDVTCQVTCESSCQAYCETTCEYSACQVACQGGCEGSGEAHQPCALDCRARCEAGSCEQGCQSGSCQSGCQACAETEIFPAVVKGREDEGPKGRVWFPCVGETFPPADENDPWWVTPVGGPIPVFYYTVVGDAKLSDDEVLPDVDDGDWTHVRCVPGNEVGESHPTKGNGTITAWSGNVGAPPHPCSVRFEAKLDALTATVIGSVPQGATSISSPSAPLFSPGDAVVIEDNSGAETNLVQSTSAGTIHLKCSTKQSYTAPVSVKRREITQNVHTIEMVTPGGNTTWYGTLGGDVDPNVAVAQKRVNYRGTRNFTVTFKDPPPRGARVSFYYIREDNCRYEWLTTGQGIEGGDLVYQRPQGGEDDGWLVIDTDPTSPFYKQLVHGDPQSVKLDTSLL